MMTSSSSLLSVTVKPRVAILERDPSGLSLWSGAARTAYSCLWGRPPGVAPIIRPQATAKFWAILLNGAGLGRSLGNWAESCPRSSGAWKMVLCPKRTQNSSQEMLCCPASGISPVRLVMKCLSVSMN